MFQLTHWAALILRVDDLCSTLTDGYGTGDGRTRLHRHPLLLFTVAGGADIRVPLLSHGVGASLPVAHASRALDRTIWRGCEEFEKL